MAREMLTVEEVIQEARRRLFQGAWDYLVGGSESETTLRRNRSAFDRIALRPRVLVDVSKVDPSASLLGHSLRIPVLLAPIGSLEVFDPEAGVGSTKAAGQFGTVHVVSSVTQPALEETAAATDAPKIYQLYLRGDWEWRKAMLDRALKAGYKALTVTVDTAVMSRRERPLVTRWAQPTRRNPVDPAYAASVTWDDVEKLRDYCKLPILLKGIGTAEDAEIAVQRGIDVIWVSNHGGRQLDHGLGALDTLPEIVKVAKGKAQIIVDGGVHRGTDVLKAIAMGADCVAIGRLQGYGLAAGGAEGVLRVLEILEDEINIAMGLSGVTKMSDLNPNFVTAAEPVTPPHEMSSWPNLPGNRIV